MSWLDAIAPIYLAIGAMWAIRAWRAMLERPDRRPLPVPVTLAIGVVTFIVVIATWPIALGLVIYRHIAFVARWFYDGFTNRTMRRLLLLIIAMSTVNLGVLAVFHGPAYILPTVWGWAFAVITARMGYDIGAYAPRRVVGVFKAVHVNEDGSKTPVSGRLLLDANHRR